MAPRGESRTKLLKAAADLFQRKGYHGTGVNALVAESGAPRGSVYFLFPGGKEQLAAEALERAGEAIAAVTAAALAEIRDPAQAMRRLAQLTAAALEGSNFERGCPLATVTLEVASESEKIRRSSECGYRRWLEEIAARLRNAGWPRRAAHERASLILSALQGAMILSRAQRDTQPLEQIGSQLARLLDQDRRDRASPSPRRQPTGLASASVRRS
jgi:TetR/AcrR family transcriptional repressor of lmrAB and yxaGH operons